MGSPGARTAPLGAPWGTTRCPQHESSYNGENQWGLLYKNRCEASGIIRIAYKNSYATIKQWYYKVFAPRRIVNDENTVLGDTMVLNQGSMVYSM